MSTVLMINFIIRLELRVCRRRCAVADIAHADINLKNLASDARTRLSRQHAAAHSTNNPAQVFIAESRGVACHINEVLRCLPIIFTADRMSRRERRRRIHTDLMGVKVKMHSSMWPRIFRTTAAVVWLINKLSRIKNASDAGRSDARRPCWVGWMTMEVGRRLRPCKLLLGDNDFRPFAIVPNFEQCGPKFSRFRRLRRRNYWSV